MVLGRSSYTVRSYRLGVEHFGDGFTHDRWTRSRERWSVTTLVNSRREQVVVAIDAPLGRSTIGWPRSRRSLGT
ncbi:hypothetical protein I547_7775 [Mycobacterium kansasii 824]|nr:hypothetical protein I547_7775 [Mycobacterium kansasii 824]